MDRPACLGRPDRRDEPIPSAADLRRFILLTGLRDTDACTVQWEHVNLTNEPTTLRTSVGTDDVEVSIPPGCMHRPNPNGGEDHAFTVPLSSDVIELLCPRKANNPTNFGYDDLGWVWPTWGTDGRVTHVA